MERKTIRNVVPLVRNELANNTSLALFATHYCIHDISCRLKILALAQGLVCVPRHFLEKIFINSLSKLSSCPDIVTLCSASSTLRTLPESTFF